jgi:hypothetical protein
MCPTDCDFDQLMVALETKIGADGCSKKAKVRPISPRASLLSRLEQDAATSAQTACRLAKERVSMRLNTFRSKM